MYILTCIKECDAFYNIININNNNNYIILIY